MVEKKKQRRATKLQRFYIEHNWQTMTPKELAAELKLPLPLVMDHCKKFREAHEKEQAAQQAEEDRLIRAGKLMGRVKDRGVVTMTKEASQLGDETRQSKPKKKPGYIHEINPE